MRVFERACRRAALPVAMTEGHNPRPRISLPAALSVGQAGRNEVADLVLDQWMRPEEVRTRLQTELPEGIGLNSVEIIASSAGRQPREFSYTVPLMQGHRLTKELIEHFMARREAVVVRHRKGTARDVNVRQFVKALRLEEDRLLMLLEQTEAGTARPVEVLEALGCRPGEDYLPGEIERTRVNLSP